jgi:uncharacterized membrane protein YeiH
MRTTLSVIEITAILVFAYSGMIHARKSGFDYVGVLTVALVSAFGGGTLRDVLLSNHPLYENGSNAPLLAAGMNEPSWPEARCQRHDDIGKTFRCL